jgi:hypothetical protein
MTLIRKIPECPLFWGHFCIFPPYAEILKKSPETLAKSHIIWYNKG